MKKRLLIVDDEINIRNVIKEYAEFNGYEVIEAKDGQEAVDICKEQDFDIIIMDIMMPVLDGYSATKAIREIKNIPTILLSARDEEFDKLYGYEMGIDDYVTKPFSPKILMAKINAIVARTPISAAPNSPVTEQTTYILDGLVVDSLSRTVKIDGKKVDLTPKEYDLLFYLIKHKNIALSRNTLLTDIWDYDFYGDDRTVDTHIKNLRNNLGIYRSHIVTLRGVGYKFEE